MVVGYVSFTSRDESNNRFIVGTILCTDVELKELSLDKIKSYLSKQYDGDHAVMFYEKLMGNEEAKKYTFKCFIGDFQSYLYSKYIWEPLRKPEIDFSVSTVMLHINYSDL